MQQRFTEKISQFYCLLFYLICKDNFSKHLTEIQEKLCKLMYIIKKNACIF